MFMHARLQGVWEAAGRYYVVRAARVGALQEEAWRRGAGEEETKLAAAAVAAVVAAAAAERLACPGSCKTCSRKTPGLHHRPRPKGALELGGGALLIGRLRKAVDQGSLFLSECTELGG
jgi:hypothetical protein